MLNIIIKYMVLSVILIPSVCISQTPSDYLTLNDIGNYKLDKPEKFFPGEPPIGGPSESKSSGVITPTGHFKDHSDMTYEVMYLGGADNLASPTVQVTQHTGGDSDQWLLHEVEDGYRGNRNEKLGLVNEWAKLREISGSKLFYYGGGIVSYAWVNDSVVVKVKFTNMSGPKPEPLEIVQAYLQKFPSTIPASLVLDRAHDEQWIKDEMERRLWLGDKWFTHQAANNTDISETLREVNRSLEVFLNYREKYFGVSIGNEKETLYQLLSTQNLQGMKDKLTEYKSWWTANKSSSTNLP